MTQIKEMAKGVIAYKMPYINIWASRDPEGVAIILVPMATMR